MGTGVADWAEAGRNPALDRLGRVNRRRSFAKAAATARP
jgi:hypothetical protein